MGKFRTVEQGEYVASIALSEGFFDWKHVYDHPQNAELRKKRHDPNVLYPGDVIYIPEKQQKTEQGETAEEHVFRVPSSLIEIRLHLHEQQGGEPLANVAYELKAGSVTYSGTTDTDGLLVEKVPVGTASATLSVPIMKLSWKIDVGHLDPPHQVTEPEHILTGVKARLANLGYYAGEIDEDLNDSTTTALREFQRHVLGREDADGTLDLETNDALAKTHRC